MDGGKDKKVSLFCLSCFVSVCGVFLFCVSGKTTPPMSPFSSLVIFFLVLYVCWLMLVGVGWFSVGCLSVLIFYLFLTDPSHIYFTGLSRVET